MAETAELKARMDALLVQTIAAYPADEQPPATPTGTPSLWLSMSARPSP